MIDLTNQLTFECPICLDDLTSSDKFVFAGTCGHELCRSCAATVYQYCIKKSNGEVVCPICKRDVDIEADLSTILTEPEVTCLADLRFKLSLSQMPDFFSCPSPNCRYGVCINKNDLQPGTLVWKCTNCAQTACLQCKRSTDDCRCGVVY